MSSIGSTHYRGVPREGTFKAWWANNVRDITYGVLYAMVKENNFNRIFVIVSMVIEFFQMIFFCFSTDFHWGGINYNTNFKISSMFVNYQGFSIVFWIVISLLVLAIANVAYIGYTFHQGEIKSINLLRTLRWICSLFVSVLFIPILYVLLGPLVCDYSTSPPSLMDYPSVPCWGTKNTPIAIIAIVLVIIFSLFSLLVGLTYYEYDPNMIKTYSRLQNRFEFGALIVKIIITFVSEFLSEHKVIYAIFSLVTSFLLVVGYIVMVPAYDHKINLARAGSYAGVFWVNVCMIIALVIYDRHNYTSTIAAGVGLPWMIGLGAFVTDKRIKHVCDASLVDGFVSSESSALETRTTSKKTLKKVVKWDQPKPNKMLKNALYGRLRFPTDVEIAARFVLQEKPNAALIEKAKTVYHTGLSKFPHSPTVMMAYTNFIFTTAGDWQLGYVTLEKLRKMHPFLDISFFIYRYDKDREQRIEGGSNKIGDFVDFMEYKKLMRAAKQYHHMALVCIRKFWRHLLDTKIDVMMLSTLSSKIAFAEKKATENYTKLLQRYPKNIRVLRDYARFLDEVVTDEKLAHKFWRKADKYEEREMEKLTESHRSQNNRGTPRVHEESEEEKEPENHSEDRSSHTSDHTGDDYTTSSASSGVKSALELAKTDKNNNLKKLGWIMFFTTLFAMVVMFTQLGVLTRQLGNYDDVIMSLDGAGGISHTGVRAASQTMDLYQCGTLYGEGVFTEDSVFPYLQSGWNYAYLAQAIPKNYNLFINNVKSLYWGESESDPFTTNRRRQLRIQAGIKMDIDPSSHNMAYDEFDHKAYDQKAVITFFDKKEWNQTMVITDETDPTFSASVTYLADLWSYTFFTSSCGFEVGTIPLEAYRDPNADKKVFEMSFVVENAPEIAKGVQALMDLYSNNISSQVKLLMISCIIIFVAAVLLLLLACLVFFMPVVNSIFQYKIKTFHVFTLIPVHVVKHMIKRKISSLRNDTSDNEEEEDSYNNNVAKVAKPPSDSKFGNWKDDEKAGSDQEIGDECTLQGTDTELPNTPSRNGRLAPMTRLVSVAQMGVKTKEVEMDVLKPPHIAVQMETPGNDVSSSSNNNNNNNNNANDIITPGGPDDDQDTDKNGPSEAPEPEVELSSFQKLKNKILLNLPAPHAKFTKLNQEEDEEKRTPGKQEEEKKKVKHARMNTASMRQVTRKLHLSYIIAILCFIGAMLVSFVTLITEFKNLSTLATDLKNSDIRTMYAHLVLYDIQMLTIFPANDSFAIQAAADVGVHSSLLWDTHRAIKAASYQMDVLYGSSCYRINQTLCPASAADYPYYDYIDKGLEYTFIQYIVISSDLITQYYRDGYLLYNDPNYVKFRTLAEMDLMDGLERLTFTFQQYGRHQISSAKLRVGIITGVVCVAFVFIHIIVFKPFVRRLREESEHTFSIVRMIPRKLIGDIPEIQAFIQESIESTWNRQEF